MYVFLVVGYTILAFVIHRSINFTELLFMLLRTSAHVHQYLQSIDVHVCNVRSLFADFETVNYSE